MANHSIKFWGQFENKTLESRFLHTVKKEIVYQNKIAILATGIGFLLVAIADYFKLGFTINTQITISIRFLFFLYCVFLFKLFKPTIHYNKFLTHSITFLLVMGFILLFLIFELNPDKQLDSIDKVVVPIIVLMSFVCLRLKISYLVFNALLTSILYIVLISYLFITPIDFVINMSVIMCVMIIGGMLFVRVMNILQRRMFAQSIEIRQLNDSLKEEMDERMYMQVYLA